MVGLQTLDLAIGVRVPASQPIQIPSLEPFVTNDFRALPQPLRNETSIQRLLAIHSDHLQLD